MASSAACLAAARDADARGRPPVDLGHLGQQHLVADLRLQRARPRRRADGRSRWRWRSAGGGGGTMFGGADRAVSGCFRPASATRPAGCSGSRWSAGLALLVLTRLRRRDPRTGWLIAVGGAFLTTAVVFSFASGIFHPYYVSLLAPFSALLVGAGVGADAPRPWGRADSARSARIVAPLAIGARRRSPSSSCSGRSAARCRGRCRS